MGSAIDSKRYARIIGVLYLLIFFLGPLAFFMGRTSVVVPGDAEATVGKLVEMEGMFRIGMVAEALIVLIEVVVSSMLYVLFKRVNQAISMAAMLARFGQSVVQAVNLLTAVPALLLLGGVGYVSVFGVEQWESIVMLFADVNAFGILLWGILFGFHLLLLGYLVYASKFLPRWLGVLLMIGGVGYLLQSYGHLVVPEYDAVLANVVIALSIPGELAFTLWLLVKGVDRDAWNGR